MKRGLIVGAIIVALIVILGIYFWPSSEAEEINCAGEGEFISDVVDMGPQRCCENLNEMSADFLNSNTGECEFGGESPFCTTNECGNNLCESDENICNCIEDCQ